MFDSAIVHSELELEKNHRRIVDAMIDLVNEYDIKYLGALQIAMANSVNSLELVDDLKKVYELITMMGCIKNNKHFSTFF